MSRPQRPYEKRYPYTLELLKSYDYATDEEVEQAMARSQEAFLVNSQLPLE
jgi:hypothetical protein|eukprot:CAMPEP_0168317130 /NCGR_PEP_ID=MMETSP0210-20121227/22783_1 /TAXON_ID=40633 /ORGANISM="Condylostoma magnum, Strain COL2" /LENGTH=50 /DNA_ID=CAMNT_0008311679 /DNA_START=8 /DNA_END=160 /DNA_ORIENTATION=+